MNVPRKFADGELYMHIPKKSEGNQNEDGISKYIQSTPMLLPINILEDFTKPLSLSFRLFGNILADELVVVVLISLVPLVVPIPMMFLGLFTSAIQALILATLVAAYIGESMEGRH